LLFLGLLLSLRWPDLRLSFLLRLLLLSLRWSNLWLPFLLRLLMLPLGWPDLWLSLLLLHLLLMSLNLGPLSIFLLSLTS
jgi:hypothetical protein